MEQKLDKILKLSEVLNITALSKCTIWLYIKKGLFPASVKLGPRRIGWFESDIQDWLLSKKEERELERVKNGNN